MSTAGGSDALPLGILRLERVGRRLEFAVGVPVAGGEARYGRASLGVPDLRRLLADVRQHLWQTERGEAAVGSASGR